jgi:hypothetical protein
LKRSCIRGCTRRGVVSGQLCKDAAVDVGAACARIDKALPRHSKRFLQQQQQQQQQLKQLKQQQRVTLRQLNQLPSYCASLSRKADPEVVANLFGSDFNRVGMLCAAAQQLLLPASNQQQQQQHTCLTSATTTTPTTTTPTTTSHPSDISNNNTPV